MVHMRPGARVRMWAHRAHNRPDVEPPALLKLLAGLSVFSIVGVMVYAGVQPDLAVSASEAMYIAFLHFLLPFLVFYTVNMNSPLSRIAIAVYVITLCASTARGYGVLGGLDVAPEHRIIAAAVVLALVLGWLYGSPKMRFYYLTISGREEDLPSELMQVADELEGGVRLSPRTRAALEWFVDRVETLVLVGFMLLAVYAYIDASG